MHHLRTAPSTLYIPSTPSMSPRSPQYITGAPAALYTAQPSPGQRLRFWESNSSMLKAQLCKIVLEFCQIYTPANKQHINTII